MKLETSGSDNYSSFFLRFHIPLTKKDIQFRFDLFNKPSTWVYGYSSRTENGQYVLFHDYDNICFKDLVNELAFLQKRFNLSDYYVFKTRKDGFHAVCLDTMPLISAYNIQKTTSCDMAFIHSIKYLKTREWVLRWNKKGSRPAPYFFTKVPSKIDKRIKSSAHAKFLEKLGAPVSKGGSWDLCKKLGIVKYTTANRVGKV